MRRILHVCFLFFLLLVLISTPVSAQSFGARDIIAAVNRLRQSQGLAPYEIDGSLMAYAQEHSEYQAKKGISTHTHSDGSSPGSHGVTENIASGNAAYMSLDYIINTIWADALHMNTMIGYETGYIGAGLAVNNGVAYITIDVRPGNRVPSSPGSTGGGATSAAPVATQIALVPLVTATPNADGAIVHVVGYGQSLWSIAIAYGVKIDDIRNMNGLIAGSTDIYAGQKLVIRQAGSTNPQATNTIPQPTPETGTPENKAGSAMITPPDTATPVMQPTETLTPLPTHTPEPTHKPPVNLPGLANTKMLAIGLILVGAIGVGWVLLSGFSRREE